MAAVSKAAGGLPEQTSGREASPASGDSAGRGRRSPRRPSLGTGRARTSGSALRTRVTSRDRRRCTVRSTIPLGRIAGIPVGMHWSALIGIALLGQLVGLTVLPSMAPGLSAGAYWLAGGLAALGLGGSLLTHELAHAVVARRAGLGVRRITLWLLGGVSELVGQPSEAAAEVRIALVGPVTSLGLGGLLGAAMVVARDLAVPSAVVATLSWLATMNILLGVFNLLPGTPLDGGRVLHGLLWRHTGNRERATRAATTSGQVLGALLAGTGILLALHGRLDG